MTRPSPYVGLVPYSESDADLFFGRERERRIIGANLRASRLTLLYGASGVGKSSLLQAGLLPGLHAAAASPTAPRWPSPCSRSGATRRCRHSPRRSGPP